MIINIVVGIIGSIVFFYLFNKIRKATQNYRSRKYCKKILINKYGNKKGIKIFNLLKKTGSTK